MVVRYRWRVFNKVGQEALDLLIQAMIPNSTFLLLCYHWLADCGGLPSGHRSAESPGTRRFALQRVQRFGSEKGLGRLGFRA